MCVDDHPLLREGLAAIIEAQTDMTLVAQAANAAEAIHRHREVRPDITLMDLRFPDLSGIDAMVAIRQESTDARIIILTTFEGDVDPFSACLLKGSFTAPRVTATASHSSIPLPMPLEAAVNITTFLPGCSCSSLGVIETNRVIPHLISSRAKRVLSR